MEAVMGNFSCHGAQLFIFRNSHRVDQRFHVAVSCNFCVEAHYLTYAPGRTSEGRFTIKSQRKLKTIVLISSVSSVSAGCPVTYVRIRRVELTSSFTAEYVALEKNL